MSGLSDLYQEILLEHNRRPRNFRSVDEPTSTVVGYNPLCGDQITLYLKVVDDVVEDVGFQGVGCAISRASASMMTQSIRGKSLDDVHRIFDAFHEMLIRPDEEPDYDILGDLETLAGVNEYPTRIKCAVLPWHTMRSALSGDSQTVTTE